jgi:hypothetical protein
MPQSIGEFNVLKDQVGLLIFGDHPDVIIAHINRYSCNLEAFRIVISEFHFPTIITYLLYVPIYIMIMLLNCIKESVMSWIVIIALAYAFIFVVGGLLGVVIMGWRGYKIYNKRFNKDKDDEEEEERPQQSGPAPSGATASASAPSQDKREESKQDKKEE